MTDSQTPLKIPSIAQPIATCRGCGGALFANVFHVCAFNAHMYELSMSTDELKKLIESSYVAPPPAPDTGGWDSAPPQLSVETNRTHCKCGAELKPDVAHHCHANQQWHPPVISSTEITEKCPKCNGTPSLISPGPYGTWPIHVVVCGECRVYVYPPAENKAEAIVNWNRIAACGTAGEPSWALWRSDMSGDDQRRRLPEQSATVPNHPDLTNYSGACPLCFGRVMDPNNSTAADPCDVCDGSGVIPPPAKEVAP